MDSIFGDDDERESGARGHGRRGMDIPPLIQCDSVHLSWTGKPPFKVSIHDAEDPSGPPIKDFGQTTESGIDWKVEVPAGREVVFTLEDANGSFTSDDQTIRPGPNCPTSSSSDVLPQVFTSPTTISTSYDVFTSAASIASSSSSASSSPTTSSSTTTTSSTSSTSSSSSASSSSQFTTSEQSSTVIQIVTLTRTPLSSSSSFSETASDSASTQDLSAATSTPSVSEKGGGSKVGTALGVTLGLGIPILLICLAYFFHRRRNQQEVEEPYASFSDLHSRPASVYTIRSFYSLGLGEDENDRARDRDVNVPPVPPIPAAFDSREREKKRSLLPYEQSDGKFMGRLSIWEGGKYRLEDVVDEPFGPVRPPLSSGEGSVYSGMAMSNTRDSMSTTDGQRWIDEYAQRRETFRSGTNIMNRPLSHRVV